MQSSTSSEMDLRSEPLERVRDKHLASVILTEVTEVNRKDGLAAVSAPQSWQPACMVDRAH